MALKNCRECQRPISPSANPCPLCGKRNPHGLSAIVRYGGGFLVFVVGMSTTYAAFLPDRESRSTAPSFEPTTQASPPEPQQQAQAILVTARQLWRDYDANEVAADNEYKGRWLAVDGAVESIEKDFRDNIIVNLVSPNQFHPVHATARPSEAPAAARLAKGMTIRLLCVGSGRLVGSPTLDDCRLVQ